MVDGLCQIWPIDGLLLAEGKTTDIPSVDVTTCWSVKVFYVETSSTYKSASEKIALAPILSFLSQLGSEYHDGVHFIDKRGYVVSSPEDFAKG